MKAGWAIKNLNQISENFDNKRVPITKSERSEGLYPYYGASGIVDYVASYIFEGDALLISEDGANLLARSTPIAFPATGRYWVNNHAHIIKFDNLITQRFVELFFESIRLDKYITGAAQPKLNQKALNSIPIPVPLFVEQQRIVAIIDKAFEQIAIARANTEKNLQNVRALFESHLQNAFTQSGEGWIGKRFDDVLEIKNGRDQKPVEKVNGQYPIYGSAGNVMGWTDSFICEAQTTIIGRKGTINKPIFIETRFWNVDTAFGLSAKPDLSPKFLYFFCLSYDFSLHNRGTTIPSLVKTDLLEIKISVPSLRKQEELVFEFSKLQQETQRLESLYQRKLNALDALKKSLLHQAFAGEL